MSEEVILAVQGLRKSFKPHFWSKTIHAVMDSTFEVKRGEIFGVIGPNGAGKSTTIKMILGLVRPDGGSGHINGHPLGSRAAREQVAFLPETPHFYDYLKPGELLEYFGALYGLSASERKKRIPELLERVGLGDATEKPLRKFSKGMLQRVGLAQALLPEAPLIILDEPQSGLDPLGRKDVRDLILEQRDAGRTVVFSSHILPDVEAVCDRVAILTEGVVRRVGPLSELVEETVQTVDVHVRGEASAIATLQDRFPVATSLPDGTVTFALKPGADDVNAGVSEIVASGVELLSVTRARTDLEDVFVQAALSAPPRNKVQEEVR